MALERPARGAFTWPQWAEALGARLKAAGPGGDRSHDDEQFLATLEDLTAGQRLAVTREFTERKQAWIEAYRRTPHGRPVELSILG